MSRVLDTLISDAIQKNYYRPAFFVEVLYDSDPVYAWTGQEAKTFESVSYTGLGGIMQLGAYQETADSTVNGFKVSLQGLDIRFLSEFKNKNFVGHECNIGFCPDRNIDKIFWLFSGKMDGADFDIGPNTFSLTARIENEIYGSYSSKPLFYAKKSQDELYPSANDNGFNSIEQMQGQEVKWGRA